MFMSSSPAPPEFAIAAYRGFSMFIKGGGYVMSKIKLKSLLSRSETSSSIASKHLYPSPLILSSTSALRRSPAKVQFILNYPQIIVSPSKLGGYTWITEPSPTVHFSLHVGKVFMGIEKQRYFLKYYPIQYSDFTL